MVLYEILQFLGISYPVFIVSIGALLIGFVNGVLSFFFVNQKKSMLGDVVAHSALPGIALAFLIALSANRVFLLAGGLISSFLALLFVVFILTNTKLKEDLAIGVSLSFFMAIGIAIFSYIQHSSFGAQASLDHFLFGNISFLRADDLIPHIIFGIAILSILFIFLKEFKLLLFNRDYATVIGISPLKLEIILIVLVTVTIIFGVESMGVLLIAGLLIGPAVASRYWTNQFKINFAISGVIGSFSSLTGVLISTFLKNTPPGPMITIIIFFVVIFSIFFGKENGILRNKLHVLFTHKSIDHQSELLKFVNSTNEFLSSKGFRLLEFSFSDFPNLEPVVVDNLRICGYFKMLGGDKFILTHKGVNAVQKVLNLEVHN